MSGFSIAVVALAALLALAALVMLLRSPRRRRGNAAERDMVIADSRSLTSRDDATGAVRSVQTAEVFLPAEELDRIWTPEHLERLARTYWRFLARVTLGLIHVHYSDQERAIVLLVPFLKLLTFRAPEYEVEPLHGLVRWRIARGVLVAKRGHDGDGYLQIDVRRREPSRAGARVGLQVTVEVANFYPSIASRFSRRVYDATQSRIHVIVTNQFLRSLRRLDLAESRVGQLRP